MNHPEFYLQAQLHVTQPLTCFSFKMSVAIVDNYSDKVRNLELLEDLKRQSMSKKKNGEQLENGGWGKNFGFDFHYPLVSRSPEIKEIFKLIKKVSKSNASILIQGETGTGKELIASLIQFISDRSDKPFVKVNCAALPESLLESELFGHEKGAFTGAIQTRIGKFEQADGGTLFLDEIGDMHLATQAKILRVLQDREFNRVGGNRTINVDVRIIAATNKELRDLIEQGEFRPDLFYRLNVVTLNIPPLRERKEDISIIAEFFLRRFSQEIRKQVKGF
ncbi:MAG: sigma-54 interaction domain-containing protein, partial [bacterium]